MNPRGDSTSGSDGAPEPRRKSKKPKYSRFTQQELPACKPLLTPAIVSTSDDYIKFELKKDAIVLLNNLMCYSFSFCR
ncbi:hypothetical protein B296_00047747 [Ensete ventricosum]|uniref:Uncharacterized protein n=1 Tax=Ensete ventricosum TaxID=4639 RepID=A0A426XDJ4_ENSVE|nr:hypothetical protein B296_00047747 [Ensete ventricosum]